MSDENSKRDFAGMVAIVTGAAVGIGREFVHRLVTEGASVVFNDIDPAAANAAADQLRSGGVNVEVVIGDAGDLDVIDQLVATAKSAFGRLDIAIANAAICPFGKFLDYEPEMFQKLVDVNLRGSFFLAQRAARQMVEQGDGGRILMMSSVTGFQFHPDCTAYAMTKGAIPLLVKNLGVELANVGIRVNAVAPGATIVDRTMEDPAYDETWSRLTPNGRTGTVSDMANAAMFLVSSAAEHITGQTLVVDGGWTSLSPPPPN